MLKFRQISLSKIPQWTLAVELLFSFILFQFFSFPFISFLLFPSRARGVGREGVEGWQEVRVTLICSTCPISKGSGIITWSVFASCRERKKHLYCMRKFWWMEQNDGYSLALIWTLGHETTAVFHLKQVQKIWLYEWPDDHYRDGIQKVGLCNQMHMYSHVKRSLITIKWRNNLRARGISWCCLMQHKILFWKDHK